MRTRLLALLPVLLAAGPALAATPPAAPPDAMALLGRVGEHYRALSSYQYEGVLTIRMSGQGLAGQTLEVPLVLAADRIGRLHLDVRNPQVGMLQVSDGRQTTTLVYSLGQYQQRPAEPPADTTHVPPPPQNSPLARYFAGGQNVLDATVISGEPVTVEGRTADCWVVRCKTRAPQAAPGDSSGQAVNTLWVDKARDVVLRDSTWMEGKNPGNGQPIVMEQVLRYDVARVDQPLDDSLFAFTAPAGAKLVQQFGAEQQESPLIGKPAPTFTLKGVKGSTVSLASYKGKVVMLDFWATWCGPCRIEMPSIEKLYKELKPKGLVVFGVNQGEDLPTVRKFLAANPYTFPILMDGQSDAGRKYLAEALPTLVIVGRDGKVASYFRGVRDESVIREALGKAGIK